MKIRNNSAKGYTVHIDGTPYSWTANAIIEVPDYLEAKVKRILHNYPDLEILFDSTVDESQDEAIATLEGDGLPEGENGQFLSIVDGEPTFVTVTPGEVPGDADDITFDSKSELWDDDGEIEDVGAALNLLREKVIETAHDLPYVPEDAEAWPEELETTGEALDELASMMADVPFDNLVFAADNVETQLVSSAMVVRFSGEVGGSALLPDASTILLGKTIWFINAGAEFSIKTFQGDSTLGSIFSGSVARATYRGENGQYGYWDFFVLANASHTHNVADVLGGNYAVYGGDSEGVGRNIPGWNTNQWGGLERNLGIEADNSLGYRSIHWNSLNITPIEDAPNATIDLYPTNINFFNTDENEFGLGGTGLAVGFTNWNFYHNQGPGNVGQVQFLRSNFIIGDGESEVTMNGISYVNGFGNIKNGVVLDGGFNGYSFSPAIEDGVEFTSQAYFNAFLDAANIQTPMTRYYNSFSSNPNLFSVENNAGVTLYGLFPQIGDFHGNANFTGVNLGGSYGAMGEGSWQGVNVNPQSVGPTGRAVGIGAYMNNVTVHPGAQSEATIQDLHLVFNQTADVNDFVIEFTDTVTAGSEVANVAFPLITVQIQAGVSTALQVKAALEANITINGALTVTITGDENNPQVAGSEQFSGGQNPGNKRAAEFTGDVHIDGNFSFTGGISIGALNAFASHTPVDTGGNPGSVHMLISSLEVDADSTTNNADVIGVNTAALISIGENAIVNAGPIGLGLTALGLPAVLATQSGCDVSHVHAALFAISLDQGSTGGHVANLHGCRSTALPNGVTAIDNHRGYVFDLPFGGVATNTWGLWVNADVDNWFKRHVKVGGTAGSTDKVTNSNVALEVEGGMVLLPEFDNNGRNALTPVNRAIIYNNEDHKVQAYANGAWVDLN